ncbi:MAG: NAD(P)/FAD-dependent oxidoreductase [Saprospiraceae bacterium]
MSSTHFELFVIGTGSAGSGAALAAARKGRRVGIADFKPFGGTCSQRGCDPSKVLHHGTLPRIFASRYQGKGVTRKPGYDWTDLMAFKRTFTDPIPEKTREKYAEAGIETYHGRAAFTGKNSLKITYNDGKTADEITADQILIASGARPVKLDIPGEELLLEDADFLELDELPERVLFVGGGYIGCNLATIASHQDCTTYLIADDERPLIQFDADMVGHFVRVCEEIGIKLHCHTRATAVKKVKDGLEVTLTHKDDSEETVVVDAAVHCAGRTPALTELNLEAAGIDYDEKKGIKTDDYLRSTSNSKVWAGGDVADSGLPLTPIASYHRKILVANLVEDKKQAVNYGMVPTVTFIDPPIAAVGLLEKDARATGRKLRINCSDSSDFFTARSVCSPAYAYKVIIDEDSDEILGAHLIGPNAEEVINIFALAIQTNIKASTLADFHFTYPTASADIKYMVAEEQK